ncbi:hypothetical protein AVKW3434_18450 [Acidovorax sp. SUPP3434]|nr:hypothetical protein AVKW3434_18450 [Acidovorax sp. SUPP3434]
MDRQQIDQRARHTIQPPKHKYITLTHGRQTLTQHWAMTNTTGLLLKNMLHASPRQSIQLQPSFLISRGDTSVPNQPTPLLHQTSYMFVTGNETSNLYGNNTGAIQRKTP